MDIGKVYQEYYEKVFRYLRGLSANEHLSEELTQETFFRALKKLDSYRGECELGAWLCRIARNLYYDHCRREKKTVPLDAETENLAEAEERDLLEVLSDKTLALQIHKLLHELGEPYRELFMLRVFGELSFREIGEIFDKNEHWACVTFHRAKLMLRKRLEDIQK